MKFKALFAAPFFVATALLFTVGVPRTSAQEYHYSPEHRRPVEATIRDLEGIDERTGYTAEQRERYDNAIHHLQQFAERLHERGTFDKGKLDEAIGDVQHVIDHNRMGPRARQLLIRDVTELRRLREHYDERYHYRY